MQKNSFPPDIFRISLASNAKNSRLLYQKLYDKNQLKKLRRKSCLHRGRSYYVTFLLSERVCLSEVTKFAIVKIPLLQATTPAKISRYTWRDKTTPSFLSGWTGGWSSAHAITRTHVHTVYVYACVNLVDEYACTHYEHMCAHTTYLHVYQRANERWRAGASRMGTWGGGEAHWWRNPDEGKEQHQRWPTKEPTFSRTRSSERPAFLVFRKAQP